MTKFAIKNNVLTFMTILVLAFLGIAGFNNMSRDSMPPFTVRFANVVTSFPGASPDRVEMLVTDKIEKQLQQIAEIDNITSESRTGISIVKIRIKNEFDEMQPIYDDIRRKVEEIERELPQGCFVQIKDAELVDVYGIIYSITADGYSFAELHDIAKDVKDALIKLPNSANVNIVGEQYERIYIYYDNAKFAGLGMSQEKVKNILAKTNIIFPGGDIKVGTKRIILEPTGNYESIEDLKQTIISDSKSPHIVRLGDVANVHRGYKEPFESIVRINGTQGVSLGISLKEGGNIVELGDEVDELINFYKTVYPYGIEFTRSASQDIFVDKSVTDFVSNLIQSVVIVLIVMLLFLGLRTGIVVSSLVPVVMVTTLLMMSMLKVGLDQVSLAALIMALGMLVDNAIVVSESIMVKMERGQSAFDSAVESANELKVPLLISSLTTSAAFLAFFLAESTMGEVVGPIFVVITIALLASWLFALTLIPLLSIYFIKVKQKAEGEQDKNGMFEKMMVYYENILLYNLKKPLWLLLGIVVAFFLSVQGLKLIPSLFMPDSERPLVTANFELPIGTDIEITEKIIIEIEAYLKEFLVTEAEQEGIIDFTTYIGEGAPKYDLGYTAPEKTSYTTHILINTTSDEANQKIIDSLDTFCFNTFPDLTSRIKRLGTAGKSDNPIEIRVLGKDPDKLFEIIDQVKLKLNETAGTRNISDDWGLKTQKFIVNVDQARAQLAGITNQDVAISLETLLKGRETGRYREGDESIPIIMTDRSSESVSVENLEGFNIYSQQSGKNVPLAQIANINVVWQNTKIMRKDLFKTITIASDVQNGYTAALIMKEVTPWLDEVSPGWGMGYSYELGGEAESSSDGMGSVIAYLPLAFFIIVLLLVGQFNSLRKPLIVLLTIPLGLIGVVLGLLITGSYFGFFAFLGLISLAGIVINNAIVLIDRIQIELDENKRAPGEAIISAAKERFRPILLTTATTVCGLFPLWLGGGIMFEPLAISILFGLLFATVITLLFVPVVYRLLFRVKF